MTNEEEVISLLTKASPKAICDDCLANRLKFSQRQTANKVTRRLANSPHYDRVKNACSLCGSIKIVTHKKSKNPLHKPMNRNISRPVTNSRVRQKPSNMSLLESIIDIGFKHIGMWELFGNTLKLNLYGMANFSPALYAFVSENEILYVGKTNQCLSKRLYFYSKPGISQSTNIRVNANLCKMLSNSTNVNIYGYSPKSINKLGRFALNLPAGLEDDIIRQVHPVWNTRK